MTAKAPSTHGSDQFKGYQDEFDAVLSSVNSTIAQIQPHLTGEERTATIQTTEDKLDEATKTLEQMKTMALNTASPMRVRLQAKVRLNESEMEKVRRDLRRATLADPSLFNRNSDELFAGLERGQDESDLDEGDQRQRLLSGTQRLDDSNRRLEDGQRIALETEGIGASILGSLHGQRDTLTRARDSLTNTDAHIGRASRILRSMARRMALNKMITAVIIIVLLLLIVLVIWSKL